MDHAEKSDEKLQANPLLSRLLRDAGVEDSITFWGYIGASPRENAISLHPSLETPAASIEIAKDDILHVEDVPESILLFGAKVVWVRRDAAIVRSGAVTAADAGRMKRQDVAEATQPAQVEEVQSGRLRMQMRSAMARDADCHSPCATCRDCSSVCICICRYTDPPA